MLKFFIVLPLIMLTYKQFLVTNVISLGSKTYYLIFKKFNMFTMHGSQMMSKIRFLRYYLSACDEFMLHCQCLVRSFEWQKMEILTFFVVYTFSVGAHDAFVPFLIVLFICLEVLIKLLYDCSCKYWNMLCFLTMPNGENSPWSW